MYQNLVHTSPWWSGKERKLESGEGAALDPQLQREPPQAGMPGTLTALEERKKNPEWLPRAPLNLFLGTGSPWWLLSSPPAPPLPLNKHTLAHFLTKTEEAFEGGKLRFSEGKRGGEEEVRVELREQIKGRQSDPGLVLGQYHPEERGT